MSWCHQSYLTKPVDAFRCSACDRRFYTINNSEGWYERYSSTMRPFDVEEIRCHSCYHGQTHAHQQQLVPRPDISLELAHRQQVVAELRNDASHLAEEIDVALAAVDPRDQDSQQQELIRLADKCAEISARLRDLVAQWAAHPMTQ